MSLEDNNGDEGGKWREEGDGGDDVCDGDEGEDTDKEDGDDKESENVSGGLRNIPGSLIM